MIFHWKWRFGVFLATDGGVWDRPSSSPEKNDFISLEMACFGVF